MTCAILSAPRDQYAFVTRNVSAHIDDVIAGIGRVYVLYRVRGRGADEAFIDPIDGQLLLDLRFFCDEPAARRWVASDIALRATKTGGVR